MLEVKAKVCVEMPNGRYNDCHFRKENRFPNRKPLNWEEEVIGLCQI